MKKIWFIALASILLGMVSCGEDNPVEETFYIVSFDADGGTPAPEAQRVKEGDKVTAPSANPAKEGYVFLFWHLSGASTAYNFATPVTGDMTLTARYEEESAVEYWQVTWNLNGGAWTADDNHATQVVRGGTLAEPAAPTKAGNTFEGWYKEAGLTNKVTFPYDVSTVTGDFTLYAKWTAGEAQLSVSPDTLITFTSAASETKAITVTTNQSSWDAVSSQTWCTITKSGNQFTVKASGNTASTERTAIVTVSAGSAANIVINVTQAGVSSVDDSNLKKAAYCLAHIMKVTENKKKGLNINNISGVANVVYNPDNTINYMDFIYDDAVVPFLYNTPVLISGVNKSEVNAARSARNAISSGSYDYANDPSEIVAYFGPFSGSLFFSVSALGGKSTIEKMRLVANNEGITVDALNEVYYPNNSYKILIFGKNKAGVLIGKYVGYSTYNTTQSQLYLDYWNIDPDDTRFGQASRMAIP